MSTPVSNDYVYALDREFVFHSWSTQGALNPLVIAGGQGCTLWDYEGREYLDFSSQLVNTNIGQSASESDCGHRRAGQQPGDRSTCHRQPDAR